MVEGGPVPERFGCATSDQSVGVAQGRHGQLRELRAQIAGRAGSGRAGLVAAFGQHPLRMDTQERIRGEGRLIQQTPRRTKTFQHPKQMHLVVSGAGSDTGRGDTAEPLHGFAELTDGGSTEPVLDLAHRQQTPREIRRAEFADEPVEVLGKRCRTQLRLRSVALVDHAPDAAALAVAARMHQRHLVVADDAVVEIRDVESAVRPEDVVDRTEPRIGRGQEIRLLGGLRRRTGEGDLVAVQPAGHHVADEERVLVLGRPQVVVVVEGAVDGGAAVGVLQHHRRVAEAVVRLAEARIPAAIEQLVDGRAVAIAGVEVAAGVPREAEGVHLPVGVLLDARAVEADAVGVAGVEVHVAAISRGDVGVVVVAVRGVEPSVEAAPERCLVAVRVAGVVEGAVEHRPFVGFAVAVGVLQEPDVRDAPDDGLPVLVVGAERIDADGDVQAVSELGDFPRASIGTEILEDHQPVAPDAVGRRGPRILDAGRRPQPSRGVEGQVEGFVDVRLRGHELDLEPGRQLELRALVGRRQRRGGPHPQAQLIVLGPRSGIPSDGGSSNGEGEDEVRRMGGHGSVLVAVPGIGCPAPQRSTQ